MTSIVQKWVSKAPLIDQSIMLQSIRMADTAHENAPLRRIMRMYRAVVMVGGKIERPLAIGESGDRYMCASDLIVPVDRLIINLTNDGSLMDFLVYPEHFQTHFMDALNVLADAHEVRIVRDVFHAIRCELGRLRKCVADGTIRVELRDERVQEFAEALVKKMLGGLVDRLFADTIGQDPKPVTQKFHVGGEFSPERGETKHLLYDDFVSVVDLLYAGEIYARDNSYINPTTRARVTQFVFGEGTYESFVAFKLQFQCILNTMRDLRIIKTSMLKRAPEFAVSPADEDESASPMMTRFPSVAKSTLEKYGDVL